MKELNDLFGENDHESITVIDYLIQCVEMGQLTSFIEHIEQLRACALVALMTSENFMSLCNKSFKDSLKIEAVSRMEK